MQASGWPTPEPGDVLSYAYLWAREAEAGREEGLKDRPTVVVLAQQQMSAGLRLIVAPVTHSPPEHHGAAIEMPRAVKRDLGLDEDRSWIVTIEVNSFIWPGPDVRPIDGGDPLYGAIPDWLLRDVQQAIGDRAGRRRLGVTKRDS